MDTPEYDRPPSRWKSPARGEPGDDPGPYAPIEAGTAGENPASLEVWTSDVYGVRAGEWTDRMDQYSRFPTTTLRPVQGADLEGNLVTVGEPVDALNARQVVRTGVYTDSEFGSGKADAVEIGRQLGVDHRAALGSGMGVGEAQAVVADLNSNHMYLDQTDVITAWGEYYDSTGRGTWCSRFDDGTVVIAGGASVTREVIAVYPDGTCVVARTSMNDVANMRLGDLSARLPGREIS